MTQRVLIIKKTQLVSGTEIMVPGEGGGHTRLLWASVPKFSSRPDVTITIYSDDNDVVLNPDPLDPADFNPGATFAPWAIQYLPLQGVDGWDLIAISASNTQPGVETKARVFCSYLAIGGIKK